MKNNKSKRSNRLNYEIEKSINLMLDKKLKKTKIDLKSLILSASRSSYNRSISQTSKNTFDKSDAFGSSMGQVFSKLANTLQRNLYRNL